MDSCGITGQQCNVLPGARACRCADTCCGAQADEASGRLREVLTPYIEAVAATFAPLKGQLQFAALREATESSEFGELARRLRRSLGGPDRA